MIQMTQMDLVTKPDFKKSSKEQKNCAKNKKLEQETKGKSCVLGLKRCFSAMEKEDGLSLKMVSSADANLEGLVEGLLSQMNEKELLEEIVRLLDQQQQAQMANESCVSTCLESAQLELSSLQ